MALQKPTPEEKLFAVIQGAKVPPVRARGSAARVAAAGQKLAALVGPIDLPRINAALLVAMGALGLGLVGQLFMQPSVERLMARSDVPAPFRIGAPLEGLKPLEGDLPAMLEADPFRVGQAVLPAASQDGAALPQDAQSLAAPLRLVGIAWGDPPTAMIEQDKQTYFLKAGDPIGAFTVKEILRDHVILHSGTTDVELF